jgi:hypothetical protein
MRYLGLTQTTKKTLLAASALAAFLATAPVAAEAALHGVAGNAIIRNTATADFNDALGNARPSVSSSLDITVNTVAATPVVFSFAPASGNTDGTGSTLTYAVRIVTNSNGPGAISFNTADGSFNTVGAGAIPTVPGGIFLGATIIDPSDTKIGGAQTVNAGASLTFAVPNDNGAATDSAVSGGTTGDGIINAIKNGDIVYIYDGGTHYYGPFTVGTVNDPAVGTGTMATPGSLQLTNNTGSAIGPFTPAYGWQIVEAKDVTVTVTQGTVSDATKPASWVTTVTATMAGAPDGTGTVTTSAHLGLLAVTKYVRNVTNSAGNSGGSGAIGPVTINGGGFTYYMNGVTGKPGEVLEYLLTINDAGTGKSTTVTALDSIPYYTTLVTGSTYGTGSGTVFAHTKLGATEVDLKTDGSAGNTAVAYGASAGTAGGSTMSFYLGNNCSASGGGTLNSTQTLYLIYRVTIN